MPTAPVALRLRRRRRVHRRTVASLGVVGVGVHRLDVPPVLHEGGPSRAEKRAASRKPRSGPSPRAAAALAAYSSLIMPGIAANTGPQRSGRHGWLTRMPMRKTASSPSWVWLVWRKPLMTRLSDSGAIQVWTVILSKVKGGLHAHLRARRSHRRQHPHAQVLPAGRAAPCRRGPGRHPRLLRREPRRAGPPRAHPRRRGPALDRPGTRGRPCPRRATRKPARAPRGRARGPAPPRHPGGRRGRHARVARAGARPRAAGL